MYRTYREAMRKDYKNIQILYQILKVRDVHKF